MAGFQRYEPCPRCRAQGRDRRGDNLARYKDDSAHCFSCGYHSHARTYVKKEKPVGTENETALPRDFTREVPAAGWKWLLQYGLPYTYWKPYCGYSESQNRLVITHGEPVQLSVGRYLPELHGERGGEPPRKWRMWGDRLRSATVLEPTERRSDEVILTEDLISAHKVRQAGFTTLPIFGTGLYPKLISTLRPLKRPTRLWLDRDQYTLLAPKINRLQAFLGAPVTFVNTTKDPKEYSLDEIREILK